MTHATTFMKLEEILSEISYSQKDRYHDSHYELPRVKFIEAKWRTVVTRGWRMGKCEIV